MDPDPTAARPALRGLARLRRRRATDRPVADGGAEVPFAVPAVPTPDAPRGLSDVSSLVAVLTRQGHVVRVSDRTAPGTVPSSAARAGYLVLEEVVAILVRRAATHQRIHVRIRTEDDELVLAVQTLPEGDRVRSFVLGERDEAALRRRVEAAAGRATIRTTHGGNWLAMARLPL
jgi:hypothetical protein